MRDLAQGLAQVLLVELGDALVLVRIPRLGPPVGLVDALHTFADVLHVSVVGLAAASGAAAGAGHDLHEVHVGEGGVQSRPQPPETVDHSEIERHAVRLDREALEAIKAPRLGERSRGRLSSKQRRCRADGGLHDPARPREEAGGAGGLGKGGIERSALFEGGEIDPKAAPQSGQLPRGQNVVHVTQVLGLELLGGAGHERHQYQALVAQSRVLRVDLLDQRSGHLLRRLAGGKVRNQVGPM